METTTPTTTTEKPDPTFTDTAGKVWKLTMVVSHFKPLEALLGYHPRKLITEPDNLLALLVDSEKLAAVGHCLLPPVGVGVVPVSLEQFTAHLDAEALDRIAEIVIRLACGFFAPRGRGGEVADSIIGALREAGAKAAAAK